MVIVTTKQWKQIRRKVCENGLDTVLSLAPEFLSESSLILPLIKANVHVLKHAAPEIRNNKEVMLEAMRTSGAALLYARPVLQDDRDFVLEAVALNAGAFSHASPAFRCDPEFIRDALAKNSKVSVYLRDKERDLMSEQEPPSFATTDKNGEQVQVTPSSYFLLGAPRALSIVIIWGGSSQTPPK